MSGGFLAKMMGDQLGNAMGSSLAATELGSLASVCLALNIETKGQIQHPRREEALNLLQRYLTERVLKTLEEK